MIRVLETDFRVVNMRMRMPFRYGIVTVSAMPHLFVRAEVEIDGDRYVGLAADHLVIKWFTKDPQKDPRDELSEMRNVIETAADVARAAGKHASVFDWWFRTYQGQSAWAGGWGIPALLAHFGTSLMERAVIDAFCKSQGVPFAQIARENRLGVRLGQLHAELSDAQPKDFLPSAANRSLIARHTVGLVDPLTDAEIAPADRLSDDLPQSLEACVAAYGLTHFKIKLFGDVERDVDRLRRIAEVLHRTAPRYRYTLDANENFNDVATFRELWTKLSSDPSLGDFMSRLIFIEQPFHRAIALAPTTFRELLGWTDRPPIIIDESDDEIATAARAVAGGYVGTSHKNCKGVIKSIINASLLEHRRRTDPTRPYVLSGEDLCNVAPIALQQDLAVAATLGIDHLERNGHHYYRGLSMLPADAVAPVVERHADLYRHLPDGTAAVRIEHGRLAVGSVVDAPFGVAGPFDPSRFTPLQDWNPGSLGFA